MSKGMFSGIIFSIKVLLQGQRPGGMKLNQFRQVFHCMVLILFLIPFLYANVLYAWTREDAVEAINSMDTATHNYYGTPSPTSGDVQCLDVRVNVFYPNRAREYGWQLNFFGIVGYGRTCTNLWDIWGPIADSCNHVSSSGAKKTCGGGGDWVVTGPHSETSWWAGCGPGESEECYYEPANKFIENLNLPGEACTEDHDAYFSLCGSPEVCMNGIDDDWDGETDENDADCKVCTNFGSSANPANGRLNHTQPLFDSFSLRYNSYGTYSTPVALHWRHNHDIYLYPLIDGNVIYNDGSEDRRHYKLSGNDYISEEDDTSTLSKDGTGWVVSEKGESFYNFSSNGKLTNITYRDGSAVFYTYSSDLLKSINDPIKPAPATLTYDATGRLDYVTDPKGNVYDLVYTDSRLTEVIYPLPSYSLQVPQTDGNLVTIDYPEGTPSNPRWTYTYYGDGLLETKTDLSGLSTTYNYLDGKIDTAVLNTDYGDKYKQITYGAITDTTFEITKTELDGSESTNIYSKPDLKLREKRDAENGLISYDHGPDWDSVTYPDRRHKTITRYDAKRNVAAVEEYENDILRYTTSYTYNTFGQISTTTTPLEEAYDQNNVAVLEATIVYRYNDDGRPTYIKDSLGNETNIHYEIIGSERHETTTDPLGRITLMVYDEQDRLISIDAPSSVDGVNAETYYTYGVYGNMSTMIDAMGRVTRFKYDSLDRMVQTIASNDERTTYVYNPDGSIESAIDAKGNKTSYTYTIMGQQKEVIDAMNNSTFMSYSSGGGDKLASLTDANGKATSYTYDNLGRLLTESDVTGLQKSFAYDPNRYESTKTDAKGNKLSYVNDFMGRLVEKKFNDETVETYNYYINGWLKSAAKDGLTYTYTYFANGRVRDVTDSNNKKLSYKYDVVGNKTEIKISDGVNPDRVFGYEYTSANQLDIITAGPGIFDYDYRRDGSRDKLTFPNGVFTNYSYDASGRMVFMNTSGVLSNTYTYDKVGNRLSNVSESKAVTYTYDDLYRLRFASHTSVEGAQFENYTYDAIGNRQAHDNGLINNYYPGFDPVLTNNTTAGDFTYYDVAGESYQTPFSDVADSMEYGYDYEERLVRVKRVFGISSTVVEYKYDFFGRRIGRTVTVDGSVTANMEYLYDNEDIVAVYENGSLVKEFVHGPGIDEPLAVKSGGSWYYYHADGLGSVLTLSDSNGQKVGTSFGYDSFGNLVKGTLDETYTYTGREWDKDAGLYYYRARFYDPEIGRFISKDPIGFDGGDVNLYSYVGQNGITRTDPSGLFSFVDHYYTGGGRTIDLANVGLLSAFQNSGSVTTAVGMFHLGLGGKAKEKASSLCDGCDTGTKVDSFSASDTVGTNVTQVLGLFSIGNSSFFRKGNCQIMANCDNKSFTYQCSSNFSIRDWFRDPLDIGVEVGGTPYRINADWTTNSSGCGSW